MCTTRWKENSCRMDREGARSVAARPYFLPVNLLCDSIISFWTFGRTGA